MPEPVVTAGAALIGVGGWFANKIFGPSADEMGNQLKVYFSSRIRAIFDRAGTIAKETSIDIGQIPPGLLARLVADASFSEDSGKITEWWANLFIDASGGGSNVHAVYSDMMSKIGRVEAMVLSDFSDHWQLWDGTRRLDVQKGLGPMIDLIGEAALNWFKPLPLSSDRTYDLIKKLLDGERLSWPMRPVMWSYPYHNNEGDTGQSNGVSNWYQENLEALGNLVQAGPLDYTTLFLTETGGTAWVKMIYLTPLGYTFYSACVGRAGRKHVAN